jgi:hypothetical protein
LQRANAFAWGDDLTALGEINSLLPGEPATHQRPDHGVFFFLFF